MKFLSQAKKNISIHMSMPNTSTIAVEEIVVLPHGDVRLENGKPVYRSELFEAIEKVRTANPNIPISFH